MLPQLSCTNKALLLDRELEKSLRTAGSGISTAFAWQALEMIRCADVEVGQRRKICVTRGNQSCDRNSAGAGHYLSRSATCNGRSSMAHVVTKLESRLRIFSGLQATVASMR